MSPYTTGHDLEQRRLTYPHHVATGISQLGEWDPENCHPHWPRKAQGKKTNKNFFARKREDHWREKKVEQLSNPEPAQNSDRYSGVTSKPLRIAIKQGGGKNKTEAQGREPFGD